MSNEWNYDMSAAPRGRTEKRVYQHKSQKDKTVERDVFVPELIIAASKSDRVVTASRWLPNESRWNMFAKGEEPLAWMPWPTHPES